MDVVVDDRLLIEELLSGLDFDRRRIRLYTTTYWYYRACRAAIGGAGGYLSGPFAGLPKLEQQWAITSMLQLPETIRLPVSRQIVPVMVELSGHYPKANLLSLEAVAVARSLGATVWLSSKGAAGILPGMLDVERVKWKTIRPGG